MSRPSPSRTAQSLIEVLVGLGIGALLIMGAASIIAPSLQSNKQVGNTQNEAQLGSELLGNVREWAAGNWNNVLSLATGSANTYYLNTVNSPFVVVGSSGINQETITAGGITYKRSFYLSDVYRDSNGNVTTTTSGNFYDPSTKQVTAIVQVSGSGTPPVTFTLYITRNESNAFDQTSWVGGAPYGGPTTLTPITFASSVEINYSGGNLQIALAPSFANGENASSELGQYDVNMNQSFAKGGGLSINNGPNEQGLEGPSGLAIDSVNQRLFIVDSYNCRILVFPLDSNDNITTTTPSYVLGEPDFTTSVCGTTQSAINQPSELDYDSVSDRLFVTDTVASRVLVFNVAPGTITNNENASYVLGQTNFTNATSGPTQSTMDYAAAVAYDSVSNRLFVTDWDDNRVLVFNVATATIANGENASYVLGQTNFTGSTTTYNPASQSGMDSPYGIAYDASSSRLFVGDEYNSRVLVFNVATATIANGENASYVLGQPNFASSTYTTTSTQSNMTYPIGLSYDAASSRLFVADGGSGGRSRVLVFNVATATIANNESSTDVIGQASFTTDSFNSGQNGLDGPDAVAYDPTSGNLFVSDGGNSRILQFAAATSTISVDNESASNILGEYTSSMASDYNKSGLWYGGDANNGPNPQGFNVPQGTAIDAVNHRVFVADSQNSRILVFPLDSNNNFTTATATYVLGVSDFTTAGTGNVATDTVDQPAGLAYDSASSRLFVADDVNCRILVFNVATATIANNENASYVLGQANFTNSNCLTTQKGIGPPLGLAYDPNSNRLFVGDTLNNRILVFNVATATIANNESSSYELGQATFTAQVATTTQKGMNWPEGVAYDPVYSRLFVGDTLNNRILVFNVATATIANDESSTDVIGQANFTSKVGTTTQSGLSDGPFTENELSLIYDPVAGNLFVSDAVNNRVLVYPVLPSTIATSGEKASYVLGQSSFTASSSAAGQNGMGIYDSSNGNFNGLSYDPASYRLMVSDVNNSRILEFATASTSYAATGTLDSTTFDTGVASGTELNSVIWQGSANGITTPVGFQFAVSNASSGPWNFIGPDGTINTNYTGAAGTMIPLSSTSNGYTALNGYRYFRYRIILYAGGSSNMSTPTVTQVIVNWSP